ncbi:MAG: hypothetical protein V3V49_14780, partial [Candidatus Krumholzibacteria bacterium]
YLRRVHLAQCLVRHQLAAPPPLHESQAGEVDTRHQKILDASRRRRGQYETHGDCRDNAKRASPPGQ